MNQETIKVELLAIGEGMDVLRFYITETPIDVDLNNSSCQSSLKSVFAELLKKLVHVDLELKLDIEPEYTRVMYKEVCYEYIKDLNRELNEVKNEIRQELSGNISL